MDDVIDADDIAHAIERAIFALQQVAIAHPGSSEHDRAMHNAVTMPRIGLVKILSSYKKQN